MRPLNLAAEIGEAMANKQQDPLEPQLGYHPFRAVYQLPHPVIDQGCRTFDNPESKVPHPGVASLLAVPGVNIVSLQHNRVSVLRDSECPWDSLLPTCSSVVRTQFLNQDPLINQPEEG